MIDKRDYDIGVLSYDTLSSEFKVVKKAVAKGDMHQASLFDLKFHRIVLDEAHTIRTHMPTFFHNVSAVKATNKVGLTGTFFVNKPDDIYPLLVFLGVEPLTQARH